MAEVGETPKVGTPTQIENKPGSQQGGPPQEYLKRFPLVIQERAIRRREIITKEAPARRPLPKPPGTGIGIRYHSEAPITKSIEAELARRGQAQSQAPISDKPQSILDRLRDWFR